MCARSCRLLLEHVCDYNVDRSGWVTEWLIVHAWKACVPKGTGGSNPPPSVLLRACASQDWRPASNVRARLSRLAMVRLREAGRPPKLQRRRVISLYYGYLIESLSAHGQRYVGLTDDLKQRLQEHNEGKSSYTSKSMPWKLTTYIAFTNRRKAEAFERYLKSGSGHAFARKRLW